MATDVTNIWTEFQVELKLSLRHMRTTKERFPFIETKIENRYMSICVTGLLK